MNRRIIVFAVILGLMSCGCGKPSVTWHGIYPGMKWKDVHGVLYGEAKNERFGQNGIQYIKLVSETKEHIANLWVLDGQIVNILFEFRPGDSVASNFTGKLLVDYEVSDCGIFDSPERYMMKARRYSDISAAMAYDLEALDANGDNCALTNAVKISAEWKLMTKTDEFCSRYQKARAMTGIFKGKR